MNNVGKVIALRPDIRPSRPPPPTKKIADQRKAICRLAAKLRKLRDTKARSG